MGTNIDPCVAGSIAMISYKLMLANVVYVRASTYTLFPGPVPAHKVAIPPFLILEVTVWGVVDVRDELRVREYIVNDLPGVAVPKLVLGVHPLWYWTTLGAEPLIAGGI